MVIPTVFDDALRLLDGHFTNDPTDRKRKGVEGEHLTAYAAVKFAFGVERDDHAVAYNGSRWRDLNTDMKAAFAALEEIAAETDEQPMPFIVWCSQPERTQDEVETVLSEAAKRHPEIVVDEPARRRPASPKLTGSGKLRWVVCSQLAMIASGRGTTVGRVIESIRPIDAGSDWDLIDRLDQIIDHESIPWEQPSGSEDAVALSRAWGVKTRNNPAYSFSDFASAFGNESGLASFDAPNLGEALQRFYEAHKKDTSQDQAAPLLGA